MELVNHNPGYVYVNGLSLHNHTNTHTNYLSTADGPCGPLGTLAANFTCTCDEGYLWNGAECLGDSLNFIL